MNPRRLLRLYPAPHLERPIEGLYLGEEIARPGPDRPFVYTNFVCSLDGRIAVEDPRRGRRASPPAITNPRDWRLFQELAARADVLIVSAALLRGMLAGRTPEDLPIETAPAFDDLHAWRRDRGMPPQPAVVILGRSLDAALAERCGGLDRPVYFAVGNGADDDAAPAVEATGVRILVAGAGRDVQGQALIDALGREGFRRIYSMAGPRVLHLLLSDHVLDRLYLTHFHRLLGGKSFDTLLEGAALEPPASLVPHTLYYDPDAKDGAGQLFAAYDVQ
ncbi:MAG: dihydrofolate reductase family protein [Thioalkalivibrio sp.]|nr:dihydrofolate reductase family protein [Thioalkalivibrio sp.]